MVSHENIPKITTPFKRKKTPGYKMTSNSQINEVLAPRVDLPPHVDLARRVALPPRVDLARRVALARHVDSPPRKVLARRKQPSPIPGNILPLDAASTEWYQKVATVDAQEGIRGYIGASYVYYNQCARGLKIGLNREEDRKRIKDKYKALTTEANTFPIISANITIYRGGNEYLLGTALKDTVMQIFQGKINPNQLESAQFSSPSLMSTSYKSKHALNFCKKSKTPIFLTLNAIPGAKAISISKKIEGQTHRGEGEILFPPNSCIMTITEAHLEHIDDKRHLMVTAVLRPNVPPQEVIDDEDPPVEMHDGQI